jgi:hypothetical protein
MKVFRVLSLVVAAVLTTKIAVTEAGVGFSLTQLIGELSADEMQRRTAYEVIIGYCVFALAVAAATGWAIYQEARGRSVLKVVRIIAPVATLLYGTHLAFAYLIDLKNPVLAEFVEGFAWLPAIGVLATGLLIAVAFYELEIARATGRADRHEDLLK